MNKKEKKEEALRIKKEFDAKYNRTPNNKKELTPQEKQAKQLARKQRTPRDAQMRATIKKQYAPKPLKYLDFEKW
jgi:hypothetical protein